MSEPGLFTFPFMQHAFLGCFLVSLLAGSLGWLMLLRRQAFAAHALPHIGFSGAAAAVWLHFPPLVGMVAASMAGGFFMGREQQGRGHPAQRDTMTGLILAASLGIGIWCLHEANEASSQTTTLLFGDVLGLDGPTLGLLAGLVAACLAGVALLWRPLLFISLCPSLAEAQGLSSTRLGQLFLLLAALAAAACAEIAGALLCFSLMIGPASAALKLELSPFRGIVCSVLGALLLSWGGLILSWYSNIPLPFWISLGGVGLYLLACALMKRKLPPSKIRKIHQN